MVNYVSNYVTYHVYRDWGLGLMAELDSKRQDIIKPFLVEIISGSTAGSGLEDMKNAHIKLAEDVISGAFETGVQSTKDYIEQTEHDDSM